MRNELKSLRARRSALAEERRALQERIADLQERRTNVERDVATASSGRQPERTRLQYEAERAERLLGEADRPSEIADARNAGREARDRLAELNQDDAEDQARAQQRRAELDAETEPQQRRLNVVEQDLTRVEQQLQARESDAQAERARALEERLLELAPVVEAQREAAGATGVADLSRDYAAQADVQAKSWKAWGVVFLIAVAAAVGGSLLLFADDTVSSGKVTATTVVTVARNLLIVGLLLYVVRLAALQFRVHRHLETVSRSKASALSTFNRIIAVASEREVRAALATVLAESVFRAEDTGFIDSGQDHITLIERIAAGLPRGAPPA
jgi:hypothetical protein